MNCNRQPGRSEILIAALACTFVSCGTRLDSKPRSAACDLRKAQLLLRVRDELEVMRHVRPADEAMEAAFGLVDHPPSSDCVRGLSAEEAGLSRPERFHKSLMLLRSAKEGIARTDQAAVRQIDSAIDALISASEALGIGLGKN